MERNAAFDQALQQWLNQHWEGVEEVVLEGDSNRPVGSGYSATTLIMPVSFTRNGQRQQDRVVVRLETSEEPVYPQQSDRFAVEIELQYRAMEVLTPWPGVPVAPLIGYEPDTSILGTQFYVMGFIDGKVPIEDPIYTKSGFFVDATPAQRTQMLQSGLRTLANIHKIDWRKAGVDWLAQGEPGMARQLALWEAYAERELAGRVHPSLAAAFTWLRANLPPAQDLVLSWGDSRPGNIIWQDFECACVCDFENIALGPAAMDVGWWLMFDRYAHEAQGAERLPGELTREQQLAYYEQCSGRSLGDSYYYEVFAAARYAAIVVRVMNRWVARGDLPADQTIWLENPVSFLLIQILQERGLYTP